MADHPRMSDYMRRVFMWASKDWKVLDGYRRGPTIQGLKDRGLIETAWHDNNRSWRLTAAGSKEQARLRQEGYGDA